MPTRLTTASNLVSDKRNHYLLLKEAGTEITEITRPAPTPPWILFDLGAHSSNCRRRYQTPHLSICHQLFTRQQQPDGKEGTSVREDGGIGDTIPQGYRIISQGDTRKGKEPATEPPHTIGEGKEPRNQTKSHLRRPNQLHDWGNVLLPNSLFFFFF